MAELEGDVEQRDQALAEAEQHAEEFREAVEADRAEWRELVAEAHALAESEKHQREHLDQRLRAMVELEADARRSREQRMKQLDQAIADAQRETREAQAELEALRGGIEARDAPVPPAHPSPLDEESPDVAAAERGAAPRAGGR